MASPVLALVQKAVSISNALSAEDAQEASKISLLLYDLQLYLCKKYRAGTAESSSAHVLHCGSHLGLVGDIPHYAGAGKKCDQEGQRIAGTSDAKARAEGGWRC